MKSFALPGVVAIVVAVCATSPRAADVVVTLMDVAAQSGLTLLNICGGPDKDFIVDEVGSGAAWIDFDNDGHLDALIVNGSTRERIKQGGDPMVALYRNDGKGHFADVTTASRLARRGWGMGVCVADYNNDGFDDFYVTAVMGPNVLYRNNGNGTFTDVTRQAGVGDTRWGTGCAFGDYDRDGNVDLYVANYVAFDERTIPKRGAAAGCRFMTVDVSCGPKGLTGEPDVLYHNDGHGGFTDVTRSAGINDPGYYGFGVLFTDLDDDGWPDIFVANDSTPNFLFHNNRNGTFSEIGLASGVAVSGDGREQAGMGVDAGDFNGDGRLDLVVTHFSHDYTTVYENRGQGVFADVSYPTGVAIGAGRYLGWGVGFFDVDNNGLLDLFQANGHIYPEVDSHGLGTRYRQRKQLFQNQGNKRFQEISDRAGDAMLLEKSSRGAAFGDYDEDGDIDILVVNLDDRPTLLRNDTVSGNHWITIGLVGTKSNRAAIGARVRVTAGGRTQVSEVRSGGSYLSQNDRRAHVGLGGAERVDQVEIRWPSGLVEVAKDLSADRFYVAREAQGMRPTARR
ncbi:MAG: CRTAC1 family protein [Acidobacteriota bacterium]